MDGYRIVWQFFFQHFWGIIPLFMTFILAIDKLAISLIDLNDSGLCSLLPKSLLGIERILLSDVEGATS